MMKKTRSILLALVLLWSLVFPAAAETAAGATLRLEKTEGTVTVCSAAGAAVTVNDGMRLYSGYTVKTAESSYAYVSLDSDKAVKLDASSSVEVISSGKKLELRVAAGSLFFNVTAPVKEDESLKIRTSTMVTGVRGTAGWVETVDRFTSRVHLLEGSLTVTAAEPATGLLRQAQITGGQTATSSLDRAGAPGEQAHVFVTELREEEVAPFAAVEVEKDPALAERVEKGSPLAPEKITQDAQARLEAEQAAEAAAAAAEQTPAAAPEQMFESASGGDDDDDDNDNGPAGGTGSGGTGSGGTGSGGTGSGGTGSGETVPGETVPGETVPGETESTSRELNAPTAAELVAALSGNGVTSVTVTNASLTLDQPCTVAAGQTLEIVSGVLTVADTLTVNGALTNGGGIVVGDGGTGSGALEIAQGGSLTSSGTISHKSNGSITNAGTFTNSGVFYVADEADINAGSSSADNSCGRFVSTGTYQEQRTEGFVMMQESDGTVRYLNRADGLQTWRANTTVTLTGAQSQTLTGGWTVNADNVTLDLNGRTLELSGSAVTVSGSGTTLRGGTLTTSAATATVLLSGGSLKLESGSIENTSGGQNSGNAVQLTGGTLTVSGGTIASENNGSGILTQGNCTVNVTDGTVTGSTAGISISGGTVSISGGNVTGTAGSGIYVANGALNVTKGSITGTTAGIQNDGGGTAELNGGTVTMTVDDPLSQKLWTVSGCTINGGTLRAKDAGSLYDGSCKVSVTLITAQKPDNEGYYSCAPTL